MISRLGKRLEAAIEPEAVLPTVVETIAQALKLPYTAILLEDGGSSGLPPPTALPLPNRKCFRWCIKGRR